MTNADIQPYQIRDAPSGKLTRYCISPIVLLFISILIPQPYKFLMPFVFLVNGWLMGSYNLKQQVITTIVGYLFLAGTIGIISILISDGIVPVSSAKAAPYIRIVLYAIFFTLLYRLMFLQHPTHSIIAYTREFRS